METRTEKRNILAELNSAFVERGFKESSRREAMDFLMAKGLPTSKTEEYRFFPIVRALENSMSTDIPAPVQSVQQAFLHLIPRLKCHLVVFVNGVFSPSHSQILDNSVTVRLVESNQPNVNQDPFDLLNLAFAEPTVQISIAEGQALEHPVAIVYYFDSKTFVFANPRWTCMIGAQGKATLVEYTISRTPLAFFNNKQCNIEVGENAELDYTTIQYGAKEEIQINNATVGMASRSRARCHTFTLNGQIIRNNLTLSVNGEGIDAKLNGLYLVSGNDLVDNHTVVDHRKPNSYSNEMYKGVMDNHGKAVFNGKIFVRPDAQKTNAFQSNRNILLSETANIHTKPQLEIWADDVKCSHGCTTGQLDEEALFYLRSRGIPKDLAKGMLLNAFAGETLDGLQNETVRSFIDGVIMEKLHPAVLS